MCNVDIFTQYRFFLREMVDNKYLQHYDNANVLGENFIDNMYVVLFESTTDFGIKRYIIVENIKSPIIAELKELPKNDKYVTMSKQDLAQIIPERLRKLLAERGLATTVEIGLRTNKRFSWHRLVACLYYNCINKQVHHINKCEEINDITNLLPLSFDTHKSIDNDENYRSISLFLQCNLKATIKSKHRQTIASNENVLTDIFMYIAWGYSKTKLINKFRHKIKKSSIYKYTKYFFYATEFLLSGKTLSNVANWELYGKLKNRWQHIINFES